MSRLEQVEMSGQVLEMDGVWTRTHCGSEELKVVRDEHGSVIASFGKWSNVVDEAYNRRVQEPIHLVSDGDRSIAEAIQMVYGSKAAHQLCQFHLLQEARRFAVKIVDLTDGHATYWCRKALAQGLIHLRTGQDRYKTTSSLEQFQWEIRRRESMGTLWSPHNLLILLQRRGLICWTT